MSSVTDPAGLLATLLDVAWSSTTGGLKPTINTKWWTEAPDRKLAADGRTRTVRHITVREIVASHEVFGELIEQVDLEVQIDAWAQTEGDVHQLRDEVKRILRANANSPVTGVAFITVTAWRDTSAFDVSSELYRQTASAYVTYEEE